MMRMPAPKLSSIALEGITDFRAKMYDFEREVTEGRVDRDHAQQRVSAACDLLFQLLRAEVEQHPDLEQTLGDHLFQETSALFMLSQMARRSYLKPRGYPGDFLTIDLIYRDIPQGYGPLGALLDRWCLDMHVARAVKNRRKLVSNVIRDVAEEHRASVPVQVMSLACGPCREVLDFLAEPAHPPIRFTGIDIDREAVGYATVLAASQGVSRHCTFVWDNVVHMSQGRGKTVFPPQHLIYSIGLIDYLPERLVVQLLNWMHNTLLPGGTAIVGNFDRGHPDKFFMNHILHWKLHLRSAEELRALFARSSFGDSPVEIRTEATGINLFAFCQKA